MTCVFDMRGHKHYKSVSLLFILTLWQYGRDWFNLCMVDTLSISDQWVRINVNHTSFRNNMALEMNDTLT